MQWCPSVKAAVGKGTLGALAVGSLEGAHRLRLFALTTSGRGRTLEAIPSRSGRAAPRISTLNVTRWGAPPSGGGARYPKIAIENGPELLPEEILLLQELMARSGNQHMAPDLQPHPELFDGAR